MSTIKCGHPVAKLWRLFQSSEEELPYRTLKLTSLCCYLPFISDCVSLAFSGFIYLWCCRNQRNSDLYAKIRAGFKVPSALECQCFPHLPILLRCLNKTAHLLLCFTSHTRALTYHHTNGNWISCLYLCRWQQPLGTYRTVKLRFLLGRRSMFSRNK